MASGYWSPLAIATADGPSLAVTAATSCLPLTAYYTFPANTIQAGTMLRVHASGRLTSVTSTTVRWDIRLGGLVIFDTGAFSTCTTGKTTLPWWLDIKMTCRASGIVGIASFVGMANIQSECLIGSPVATAGGNCALLSAVAAGPETNPAATVLSNTTISNVFDCFYTTASASNVLQVNQFILESGSVALT